MGLTIQQAIILAIVAVLGLASMALATMLLLGGAPTTAPAQRLSTLTPLPGAPQLATVATAAVGMPFQMPAGCNPAAVSGIPAQVTRVIDRNTLEVQIENSPLLQIGYAGIMVLTDVPGPLVTDTLAGKAVILVKDTSEQDLVGRVPRYVFSGGQFLNLALIQQGAAVAQPNSSGIACKDLFLRAQQQAQAGRQGVWKLTPVPTETFMPLVSLVPATLVAGCDCFQRPTCDQFKTHAAAQACYNACQDYNTRLDDNHNGIACENLP